MEREYQAYQYLTGNVENGLNPGEQYIILHDSSTMIDKKNIQFLIVEDNKEVSENTSSPVHDVNTQHFYTDLSVSPAAVVQISAHSTPPVAISNEYENTVSIPNAAMGMVYPEHDVKDLRHTKQDMDIDTNIEITENDIALSEEQCEMLQQKGWILLSMNDKVFFIDTSGLHDITDDPQLVHKLKLESQCFKHQQSRYDIKAVMLANEVRSSNTNDTSTSDENGCIENERIELFDRRETMQETKSVQQFYLDLGQEKSILRSTQDSSVQTAVPLMPIPTQIEIKQSNSVDKLSKPSNVVLNTQFLLKDIPREVILGRTVNGKNLVARVIKGKGFFKRVRNRKSKKVKPVLDCECSVNEVEFATLVKESVLGTIEACKPEDVAAADTVVQQLLQMPEYGPTLHEHRLIITKTIREENEDKEIVKQHHPVIITGSVIVSETEGRFVHIPDLLQQYVNYENSNGVQNEIETEKTESKRNMFLHIDISETKGVDNISRVAVMVNKRYLMLDQRQNTNVAAEQRPEFKCRGCGNKFTTKKSAKRHEARSCSVLKSSNGQPSSYNANMNDEQPVGMYKCNECNEYVKQKEFLSHTRTHGTTTNHDCADSNNYQEEDDRRCKLCSSTYSEPSELTQHILEVHVNNVKARNS